MKPQTKKQKGSEFEREIAQDLRRSGLDKEARRMPMSGAIYGFESDIITNLPISLECKRQETTKFQAWYEQAEKCSKSRMPVVVWRENLGQSFAFLKWNDLMEVMSFALRGGWTQRLMFPKGAHGR